MSMYNMINGLNPACIFFLPMLGKKPTEYPRFRDCFLTDDNNIAVFTRVGGGNRNCGYGEEILCGDENFIKTYDDEYDSTYGTYEFRVPEKWRVDFDKILAGKFSELSDDYKTMVKTFYPELAKEGFLDRVFSMPDHDIIEEPGTDAE